MNLLRDVAILISIVHYYVLTRFQIQRLHFGEGQTQGRICRARMEYLAGERLVGVAKLRYGPEGTNAMHVYYPSRKGLEFLASHLEDESYLSRTSQAPQTQSVFHWI